MSLFRRQAWLGLLAIALLLAPLGVFAQDDAVRIDGSRIVANIVEPVSAAYSAESGSPVNVEISGTNTGLTRLCGGEIDIAAAARPITRAEEQACAEGGVNWVEVLLGYDALAVITNPTNTFAQCLSLTELSTLYGPAATNAIQNWSQVNTSWEAVSFVLYAPPPDSTVVNLLDELLPGDGLRSDSAAQADAAAVVSAVADDVAGLGFAPLSAINASEAELQKISLDDLSGNGCVEPTQEAIEASQYPGARGLYLYVNADSLARESVSGLIASLLGDQGKAAVAENGFLAPSDELAARVADNVSSGVTGRAFSVGEPLYTIALDVAGTVTTENSALGFGVLEDITTDFSERYSGVTVTSTGLGNAAAYRKLCNGTADLAMVTRTPTAEESTVCTDQNVTLDEFALGQQALVLVVPAAAEYAACLTTDQIVQLWQDQGENTVTNWSQLGESFPDLAVTLFLPTDTRGQTDTLLAMAGGAMLNPRRDALESRVDPLYRAAATANIEGAITYMSFSDFEKVESEVMPVAVDAGNGCIAPSAETIADGSYALSIPMSAVFNRQALARPEVQALAWSIVRLSNRETLADAGLIPLAEAAFTDYEERIVALFAEAEAAPAVEPTVEATATEEPTVEATVEATATEEPTVEATVEATATEEPTVEATTEEVTATPTSGG